MAARRSPARLLGVLVLITAACAPMAPPSPTAVVPKPTEVSKPIEKPATKAVVAPTAKPAASKAEGLVPDDRAIADFYQGKTVRLVVGFSAGGGYDTYSRLIAKYLAKYIPGAPNIIVENLPGAGSMVAMNHVHNAAPKDGAIIGNVSPGLYLQQLKKAQGVEFDLRKVHYLGAPSFFQNLLIVAKRTGVTRLEDILGPSGKEVIIGATGPGSMLYTDPLVLKEELGANIKLVSGYDGTRNILLAMERGEVDGLVYSWQNLQFGGLEEVQSGNWKVLAQFTDEPVAELRDVPRIADFGKDDRQRLLLRLGTVAPDKIARPYLLAPEVPAERVLALRTAFEKTLADKEFLAEAEKAKLDIAPLSADAFKKLVDDFLNMPADIKARLEKVL